MENKVKNVYTAYHIDNTESFGNYISVKGNIIDNKEFAFDLWFYVIDCGNVIISQQNGFSLGVQNHKIVFKHPKMRKAILKQENLERIPVQTWHNLYMGFDGAIIKFYIDGFLFAETPCDSNPCDTGEFILGEEFTGYVRSFRIYNKPITQEDYKKYCFASDYYAKTMPNVTAFMDFSKSNAPDLSGNNTSVHIHEGCSYVDLVGVYCPSEGKCAFFPDAPSINPGGLSTDEYSVYTKLYTRPSKKERHIITVNGDIGDAESMAVFSQKSSDKIKFGISLGNKEYFFEYETDIYAWVDIIVSVREKRLTAYINGEEQHIDLQEPFKRNQKGKFQIGGCNRAPELSCGHYLHTIAVFDKVLDHQDALDFMENHPFIFEDGLIALVKFEENVAREYVNGAEISIDTPDLFLAQHTVDVLPDSPYEYRIKYTKKVTSEMERWKAQFLVEGYLCLMKEAFGLAPNSEQNVKDVLLPYVSNNKTALEQIAELYTQPDIGPEDAAKAISDIDNTVLRNLYQGMKGVLGSAAGLASTAMAVGASAASAACEEFFSLFVIGSSIVLIISQLILTTYSKIQRNKPEEDDDDEEKKNVTVRLSSVSFQHAPDNYSCSAVRCRNYQGTIKGAEWSKTGRNINPAVYIADEIKKVRIKIKFRITDRSERPKGEYKVTLKANVISGERDLFDSFRYEKSGLIANKEYEAELESKKEANVSIDFWHSNIELFWGGKINDDPIVLPNTKIEVYVIPTTPCPPIYMYEGCDEDYVAVEYLKLFADMSKKSITENKSAFFFGDRRPLLQKLKEKTQDLYSDQRLKYVVDNPYNPSRFLTQSPVMDNDLGVVTLVKFHEIKFLKALREIKGNPVEIECDVYAAILAYLFSLLHVRSRLSYMYNPKHEKEQPGQHKPLKFVGVYPAGQIENGPQDIDFVAHLLVAVEARPDIDGLQTTLIFDASMGVEQNGEVGALAGYPFRGIDDSKVNRDREIGTYRGKVIENGTEAEIDYNKYIFVRTIR